MSPQPTSRQASQRQPQLTVGIEIGGTFTDVILVDQRGNMCIEKVLSTPGDLTEGAIEGLTRVLAATDNDATAVATLLHGSTIATNALIERAGAKVGFITNAGFEDMLLIGRQERDDVNNMFYARPKPLVPRRQSRGVRERISADATVLTPLDMTDVDHALTYLIEEQQVDSLAVCLLHAYRNNIHEQLIGERVAARYPHIEVSLSSEVVPEHREYERASTCVMSAYIGPVVRRYLSQLEQRLEETGCRATPLIMQSNGGVLPVRGTVHQPAGMYLSGPAAGVTGAGFLARVSGINSLLTMDIGGTSCDVSLVCNAQPQMTVRGVGGYKIHGQPLNLVMMDIIALGAGGGSIAGVDDGDLLQVGPISAGADPGPACYGRGGRLFTLTDALLLIGLLDASRFAAGSFTLNTIDAETAAATLAAHLGIDTVELARSVHKIAVANVAQGVRLASIERGRDPRDHALCGYGGVGPLLAAHVAEELDIGRVVIPPAPAVFSALGLCVADMRMDFVRALPGESIANLTDGFLNQQALSLTEQAHTAFAAIDIKPQDIELNFSADARYAGQGYELRIPVSRQTLEENAGETLADTFHETHAGQYGHGFPGRSVELVALRVAALRRREVLVGAPALNTDKKVPGERTVRLTENVQWPVHERSALTSDALITGPALVTEDTTTTVIPASWTAKLGEFGMLDLNRFQT